MTRTPKIQPLCVEPVSNIRNGCCAVQKGNDGTIKHPELSEPNLTKKKKDIFHLLLLFLYDFFFFHIFSPEKLFFVFVHLCLPEIYTFITHNICSSFKFYINLHVTNIREVRNGKKKRKKNSKKKKKKKKKKNFTSLIKRLNIASSAWVQWCKKFWIHVSLCP